MCQVARSWALLLYARTLVRELWENTAISCEGPNAMPDLCGSWGMQRPKPSKCGAASFLWASQRLGDMRKSSDWSTTWCKFRGRGVVSVMISNVNPGWIKLWLVQSEGIVFIGLVCSESGRFAFFCGTSSQRCVCRLFETRSCFVSVIEARSAAYLLGFEQCLSHYSLISDCHEYIWMIEWVVLPWIHPFNLILVPDPGVHAFLQRRLLLSFDLVILGTWAILGI